MCVYASVSPHKTTLTLYEKLGVGEKLAGSQSIVNVALQIDCKTEFLVCHDTLFVKREHIQSKCIGSRQIHPNRGIGNSHRNLRIMRRNRNY